jgi:hypothetical protein
MARQQQTQTRRPCASRRLGLSVRLVSLAAPLIAGSCADLARMDQGALQPQTVSGPCQVKKFFLQRLSTTHTTMQVDSSGQACQLTLINVDLQVVLDAAVVTERPAHGQVAAGLLALGRSAAISYTPQPGYVGPDRFSVALEPGDVEMAFAVTVQPPGH